MAPLRDQRGFLFFYHAGFACGAPTPAEESAGLFHFLRLLEPDARSQAEARA
jgi:hypothetical protein